MHSFRVVIVLLLFFAVPVFTEVDSLDAAGEGSGTQLPLGEEVAALGLGMGQFTLAGKLSSSQKLAIKDHMLKKSYEGTYSFRDGDRTVVVAADTDVVLAIYRKIDKATLTDMQDVVSHLMSTFGQPTSEAHDQVIYWAWGDRGRISDQDYEAMKKSGVGRILATVKFNSALTFSERQQDPGKPGQIHWIISSPPMLSRFLQ